MINIDDVYQKVLTIANKEQRGYISPQEFNLLADKAQKDIINNYFHGIKTSYIKPKNQTEGFDEGEMIQEKLSTLRNQEAVITSWDATTGKVIGLMPSNAYKIAALYLTSKGESTSTDDNGNVVTSPITVTNTELTRVNRSAILSMSNNPLTRPVIIRPVYVPLVSSSTTSTVANSWRFEVHPYAAHTQTTTTSTNTDGEQETTITTTVTNPTTDPGIQQNGIIEVDYWRTPHKPNWDYVIVNQKPLHNTSGSTNFELHPSEEEVLVMRILELVGVTIEKEQLQQSIMVDKANTKQEQNR
tara:strand:- start:13647 stop:14546 length:900 start_codon:yes stop_codon:yes gene_type:complete